MKFIREKKKIYYDTKVEFSDEEEANLLRYAHKNMPMEVLNDFYIEWAFLDIVKKGINDIKKHKKFLKDMVVFTKEHQKRNRKTYGKISKSQAKKQAYE